jgi:hypothetical protein
MAAHRKIDIEPNPPRDGESVEVTVTSGDEVRLLDGTTGELERFDLTNGKVTIPGSRFKAGHDVFLVVVGDPDQSIEATVAPSSQ